MARPAKLKSEPLQLITASEWNAAVVMIDAGKSDSAIAANLSAQRPHGSRRVALEQIATIRSDVTGG